MGPYKTCSKCKQPKTMSAEFFRLTKSERSGFHSSCKECDKIYRTINREKIRAHKKAYYDAIRPKKREADRINYRKNPEARKNYQLFRHYGITLDRYNQLLKEQGNCCAICQRHSSNFKKSLHVDHNHKSGKVRALLCHFCNVFIGQAEESVSILQSAIKYLESHHE